MPTLLLTHQTRPPLSAVMSNATTIKRPEPSTAHMEAHHPLLDGENGEDDSAEEVTLRKPTTRNDLLCREIRKQINERCSQQQLRECLDELSRDASSTIIPNSTNTSITTIDDNVLRFSFKGIPPEIYSPAMEYLYSSELVEKKLVLKKKCEWWLYKIKNNMSTRWRPAIYFCLLIILFFVCVGLIYYLIPATSESNSNRNNIHITEIPINRHHYINETTVISWGDKGDIENDDIGDIDEITDDNLSAFVMPIKVHNISLNAEDLLYESKRKGDSNSNQRDATSAFSKTGTYRSNTSEIWDPHPEYKLETFGQLLHLVLHQDTSFIPSNTFRVIRILNNRTEELDYGEQDTNLGCYYKGYVEGDRQSAVAVSLCGGMTGYIKTGFGTLLIQPVNQTSDDEILHRVWRHSRRNPRHAVSDVEPDMEALELAQIVRPRLLRRKRHYQDQDNQVYTLEVLAAVDASMMSFHGNGLSQYIVTLFSIVSNIFADASIGNSIKISLLNLLHIRDIDARGGQHSSPSNEKLKNFCNFLTHKGYHYDTAMLITRDQICSDEREERCSTLGLAELGTVCKARSCSIVQDNGLPAAFTIAHELGHILNMPHDDDDRCKRFNSKSGKHHALHIMSSVMGDHMHPWSWSKCSQHYVSEFLEKTDKSCLENTPSSIIPTNNDEQPGELYSLDHQCQLIHGSESTHCPYDAECRRLFCKASQHERCRSSNLPWADGTPCNSNRYWCQRGKCVPRSGGSVMVVNGGWGSWSLFTPCSLTCGGGVQESRRECNNPQPEHGGKYCVGSRKKYRSCNTFPCPIGTMDPREQQCYDMNGKNHKISGISPDAKWIPKYGMSESDKCKLFCRLEDNSAYFMLAESVKDGTTCTVDSFDKCVNGICRPAGCDNELNSIAQLDKCGVCEGRNDTCEIYTRNVYVSDLLKQKKPSLSLYYVTTIPEGASNIIITQPGYPDQNYIVLSDDKHMALLNSDKVVTPYSKKYSYAGVTLDYNGSNSTIERVNSTYSWKLKRDLIVEIISIDLNAAKKQDTILITYTYTLDRPVSPEPEVEIFYWKMQTWSLCDSLCQGTTHRQPACVSSIQNVKVPSESCDQSAKPKPESVSCNTDCVLTLNMTSVSECSASCGELGIREKTYNCIQTYPSIQRSNIVDMSYCEIKYAVSRHEQCREGCWNYTDWSPCSKTCGTGSQVREVRCYFDQKPVSDDKCNPRTKYNPEELLRACTVEPCLPYFTEGPIKAFSTDNWFAGEWGECSDWCKKNRTVGCTSDFGHNCPLDRKPKEVRNCCNIKYTSYWGNCSTECGLGKKYKMQPCTRIFKAEYAGGPKRKEYIPDSYCKKLNVRKPKLIRNSKHCAISCQWGVSDWSHCPRDCSPREQTRFVRCETSRGSSINETYCSAKKRPIQRKICENCRTRYEVIKPCDCSGYEERRVIHPSSDRRYSENPIIKKIKCRQPPNCRYYSNRRRIANRISYQGQAQSCSDIQRMHRTYKDEEYTLYIHGRKVRIYCYQMKSRTPREYITVNLTENYSIYYESKTRLFNSCPPISRTHEYPNDQNSGRTYFSKLRLNITNLRIIENDFEFSESRRQRQALGSAGDCYNRNKKCPQGDFSISLKNTDFIIRPGTVWNTYGSEAVMDRNLGFDTIDNTKLLRARCGGFCGRCSISPTKGLYVAVV